MENSTSNNRKKKHKQKEEALSEITNTYNIIPTSILRQIVANSNSKSQQIPIPNQNSRSETSIGSSNVVPTSSAAKTVQFRTPTKRPDLQFTSPRRGGSTSKAYSQRQVVVEKPSQSRDAANVSPVPVEKRKDKGKMIDVLPSKLPNNENRIQTSFGSSSLEKTRKDDGEKLMLKPFDSSLASTSRFLVEGAKEKGKGLDVLSSLNEKTRDKGKSIVKPSSFLVDRAKEKGKGAVSPSSFLVDRTKEKGKDVIDLSSLHEKTRDKGKAVPYPSDIVEITKQEGSSAALTANCPRTRRKSGKRKSDAGPSSCPPPTRTKNILIDVDEAGDINSSKPWTDPPPKCRKKRCPKDKSTSELPLDFIEQQKAYFKEIDDFELPEEEISEDELD